MQLRKKPNSSGCYQCSACKGWKPPEDFNKNKNQKSGLHYSCRSCSKEHTRKYNLPTKYGITAGEYAEKLLRQGGKCACCQKRLEPDGKKMDRPCVDHNHNSGQVRDILCGRCNIAAGNLLDSHELADMVSSYLKKWNC